MSLPEIKQDSIDDYCLGHITLTRSPWCQDCYGNIKNKECPFYKGIIMYVVEIKPKEKIKISEYPEYLGY